MFAFKLVSRDELVVKRLDDHFELSDFKRLFDFFNTSSSNYQLKHNSRAHFDKTRYN